MRRPLVPLYLYAIAQDARLQVTADQAQDRLVRHPPRQALHEHVVVDPVEELLQVHIDDHPVAFLHIAPRLQHGAVRPASRAEPVAVVGEARVDPRLQHLQQGLLDQSVGHRRDPQLTHPTSGLGNLHSAHRRGPVATR